MGKIKNALKKTPLREFVWKMRGTPFFQWLDCRHRDYLYGKKLPGIFQQNAEKEPVDEKKVIFVEQRYAKLTDNFKLLYQDLEKAGCHIRVHYLRESFVDAAVYEKNCCILAADMASAKVVFLNEGSDAVSCVPKREGQKYVQLWHACGAFKKFGMSTGNLEFGLSTEQQLRHPHYGNLDLVPVSSEAVRWAYEEAMHLGDTPDVVKPLGCSRTDEFFDPDFRKAAFEHLYQCCPWTRGKKIILYAPTFRGRVAIAQTPDYTVHFDLAKLEKKLGGEYAVLVNRHPLIKKEYLPEWPEQISSEFAKDVTGLLSIKELLCVSEICITDYSSVIFEYSLFEKPMIFYAYDLDTYFDWRGFYYSYEELTPGPVCRTADEIIDYIQHIDKRFDRQAVKDFRRKFMGACDGHATERIEQEIFGKSFRMEADETEGNLQNTASGLHERSEE